MRILAFVCVLIGFIIGSCVSTRAENKLTAKNLEAIAARNTNDTSKINLLWKSAWDYRDTNYDIAKKYLHIVENLAITAKYSSGLIEIYNKLGSLCLIGSEFDSSVYFHLKCLSLQEKTKDFASIGNTYGNLGLTYTSLKDSAKAILYLQKALEVHGKSGNTLEKGKVFSNIGIFYLNYNKNEIARKWFEKALGCFKVINNTSELAGVYNNLGISYYDELNYKQTLFYFIKAAKAYEVLKDENQLANVYDNIGAVYENVNMDSALLYLNKALSISKKSGMESTRMEIYQNLYAYYEKQKDDKNALKYYKQYKELQDSIFSVEKSKAIAELQTRYDTEKDLEKIASLTSAQKFSNLLRNALIVFALLVIAIVIALYNRFRFEQRSMKTISAEKSRSDELLLNILPAETAEELKKYGKTTAKDYEEVSVLFADIQGFTTISEQLSAQKLVSALDLYFGTFDLITARHGLEKIKTIGDAYLCAGGLPDPEKGTPADVVRAALEMLDFVAITKAEKSLKNEPFFEIRIGIHTGPIVAGVVGIKKFAYDIWGDTVNTAARLQQNSEPGKVNISEVTYEKIKDLFDCTYRGEIDAKNKGMLAMYFVEKLK